MATEIQHTVTPNHERIIYLMGLYMSYWSSFELALDCATAKVMDVPPAKVIALTGGKTVAEKIKFLKQRLDGSGQASRSAALALADAVKAESIRNSIVHSYHEYGNIDGVTSIHRKSPSKVLIKRYSTQEFALHLQHVSTLGHLLSKEFGETEAEARAFVEAAKL